MFLPSHKLNFEVFKGISPRPVRTNPVNDSQPDPKGVCFKEEEIKDQDSTDSHVLDLMNESNSKMEREKEELIPTIVDDKVGGVDLMSFDFDPELMDVYSNLMSVTNPDDFLDLDSLLYNDVQGQGKEGKFGGVKDELEEGEIPDYE